MVRWWLWEGTYTHHPTRPAAFICAASFFSSPLHTFSFFYVSPLFYLPPLLADLFSHWHSFALESVKTAASVLEEKQYPSSPPEFFGKKAPTRARLMARVALLWRGSDQRRDILRINQSYWIARKGKEIAGGDRHPGPHECTHLLLQTLPSTWALASSAQMEIKSYKEPLYGNGKWVFKYNWNNKLYRV